MKKTILLFGMSLGLFVAIVIARLNSAINSINSLLNAGGNATIPVIDLLIAIGGVVGIIIAFYAKKGEELVGKKRIFILFMGALIFVTLDTLFKGYVSLSNIATCNEQIASLGKNSGVAKTLIASRNNYVITYLFTLVANVFLLVSTIMMQTSANKNQE